MTITKANQNFSRVAQMVDEKGAVVIIKNNNPRYLILTLEKAEEMWRQREENSHNLSLYRICHETQVKKPTLL